jgi:hypothetical protein
LDVLFGKDSLVAEALGGLGYKLHGEDVVDPVRLDAKDRGDVLQGAEFGFHGCDPQGSIDRGKNERPQSLQST